MLARQFLDHLFLYRLALGQRAPGFGGDAVALMEGAQLALRESGMQLDLVHRRRHAGILINRLRLASVKFDTPIERARPSCFISIIARQASRNLSLPATGQWIRYRST